MTAKNKISSTPRAIVRFAGDSGDGMQLLGSEWVKSCALKKNDLVTQPDFPAEIRAPAGTLAGVSGFQIQFGQDILTAGDQADVLIALNPAALKANLKDLKKAGLLIINSAAFTESALKKAAYDKDPLPELALGDKELLSIDMTGILRLALKDSLLSNSQLQKCKNFFCLGLLAWLYSRDHEREVRSIEEKFKSNPDLAKANVTAFWSGYSYGENTEKMPPPKEVASASLEKGCYRALTGNKALALGLITASHKAGLKLFYASYPITPASDILHELSHHRALGVDTFQLEDEMAAISAGIGASFAGCLSATASSGPGFTLKAEALGYAVMVELPLIVIDVQRAGPSTGMPTKTEQSDLLQAIYGRHGEAPLPVLACMHPSDCFYVAIDAARIAIEFMTPVVILSDAFTANSSSFFRIVDPADLPSITPKFAPHSLPYQVYERDSESHSRAWVLPGTPGLMHQLGGLEKNPSGKISYDPSNHQSMTEARSEKVMRVKNFIPPPEIFGKTEGEILLLGFGGTFGAIRQATIELNEQGYRVSHLHLRLLNPLHDEIKSMASNFKHIVVIEQNSGQLNKLLRQQFLLDCKSLNKFCGKPFLVQEIVDHIQAISVVKKPLIQQAEMSV